MPRIRSIKPEIWADEKIGKMTHLERLCWIGLLTQADDAGRLQYNVRIFRYTIFPYDDHLTDEDIGEALCNIGNLGLFKPYRINGNVFIQITNWNKHQRINRPTDSRFPAPNQE